MTQDILKQAREILAEKRKQWEYNQFQREREFLLEELPKVIKDELSPLFQNSEEVVAIVKKAIQEALKEPEVKKREMLEAIKSIKLEPKIEVPPIKVPEIKSPEVKVNVPEVKLPKIPRPNVVVKPADVHIPETKFPKEMEVKGIKGLFKSLITAVKGTLKVAIQGVDKNTPLPVILTDEQGLHYRASGGSMVVSGGGGGNVFIQGYGGVGEGTQTVTTAGTRVQVSSKSVPCKRVFIQAHESNTGTVVVGGSHCVAALSGRQGFALFPTQGEWFNVGNLNLLYIDSTADGDKIHFYYEN